MKNQTVVRTRLKVKIGIPTPGVKHDVVYVSDAQIGTCGHIRS